MCLVETEILTGVTAQLTAQEKRCMSSSEEA